ncbi:MAG TPA: hypothetical protein VF701_12065 [Thermoanaerobaculia bacterium]
MSLTLITGTAADVFDGELAAAVDSELRARFAGLAPPSDDRYESEPVAPSAWRELQQKVLRTLEYAPQITAIEAYQAVYLPQPLETVVHLPVGSLADPLQVGSLPALVEELVEYAGRRSLPTDDLELMQLGVRYLEGDATEDLDVQMFVQLLLSARQALARNQSLWVVV